MRPVAAARCDADLTGTDVEAVFERLYDAHYGAVLAYCLRRTQRADAEDAVAEVFTIAWSKLVGAPSEEKWRAWLYGIAYRVIGHHWRSRSRYRRLRDRVAAARPIPSASPESDVVRFAQDRLVVEAARRLRPADQEILRLAGWEELPHADIADLLGVSISAVDQRFHRAKRRLAHEYDRRRPGTSDDGVEP